MLFIEMLGQALTDLFCFGAKSRGVCLFLRRIRKLNSNSQHQEVVIHYIFKESVNLQSLVFNKVKMKLRKIKVGSGRMRTHNLRISSYVYFPHDYSEKYSFLALLTDIIAIALRRLFP